MSIYKTSKSRKWYIGLMVNGKRIQFSSRTEDIHEAREIEYILKKRMNGLARDRFIAMVDAVLDDSKGKPVNKYALLSHLAIHIEEMMHNETTTPNPKTIRSRKSACRRLTEWLSMNEAIHFVNEVTPEIAWRFVQSLEGKAKTKQNIVGELGCVWKTLLRMGLVTDSPWKYARPSSNSHEERTGRAFTSAEVKAILDAPSMTSEMRTAVLLAVYTGLRQGDVFKLEWEHIDMERRMIEVEPNKTARFKIKVRIPISPTLYHHLLSLPRTGSTVIAQKPAHPERIWNACLEEAGIRAEGNEMMTFHNLRHTFATWLRDSGVDKGTQMQLGGWSNLSTANRYDHNTEQLKDAIMKIPQLE